MVMTGSQGATRKYKVWMRHRYHSCCNRLGELLGHPSFQVKTLLIRGIIRYVASSTHRRVRSSFSLWLSSSASYSTARIVQPLELALSALLKFVQLEGAHPLEKSKWEGNYLFPRELFKLVVGGLLSPEEDQSLLLSQFREYLDYDDTRYHTMQAAVDAVARVTGQHPEVPPAFWNNAFTLLSAVSLPRREPTVSSFYVKRAELWDTWKVAHLKEHRRVFQAMWLSFLKHKLPLSLYKKVLLIVHDAILPQLAQPTLMIDFLTRACDLGEC
ncbi:nucleolar complex associated 4 homolog, partial [Homo sapiens]